MTNILITNLNEYKKIQRWKCYCITIVTQIFQVCFDADILCHVTLVSRQRAIPCKGVLIAHTGDKIIYNGVDTVDPLLMFLELKRKAKFLYHQKNIGSAFEGLNTDGVYAIYQ